MYGGIDQFPTLPFSINSGAWLRPPPPPPQYVPLSYASEQHATEDLKNKGREKSMHAHHVRLYTAMQKPPEVLLRRAGARAGAPGGGGGGTQIWFRRGVPLKPPNPYLSLRVILAEKGTHY